jgi:hypothetical protein
MRTPWSHLTGLARLATMFAVLLVVSIGLCGANLALISHGGDSLIVTGIVELAGMAVGAGGLVVVGIVAVVRAIMRAAEGRRI